MKLPPTSAMRTTALSIALSVVAMEASAFQVLLDVYATSCNGDDGAIFASATGGVAPYTYDWGGGITDPEIFNLAPGFYTVTVTDDTGSQNSATGEVYVGGAPGTGAMLLADIGYGGLAPCTGECNGGFRLYLFQQAGGYSISTTPTLSVVEVDNDEPDNLSYYHRYEILGACAGQTIELSVINGCGSGSTSITIPTLYEPVVTLDEVTGSCSSADDGTISGQVTIVTDPPMSEDSWILRAVDDQGAVVVPSPNILYSMGTDDLQFFNLHPGDWTLRFTTIESVGSGQSPCIYEVPVTVPDLGTACATVSGTLHFETDEDCVQDGLEVGMPNQLMRVTPGPLYGITASDGTYSIALPYGGYDLEQLNTDAVQLCPGTAPVPITVSSGTNVVLDLADSLLTPFDMRAYLYSGTSRVGFPFRYSVRVINSTGHPSENVSVSLAYDPLFPLISASSGANTSVPGQVEWSIPVLGPFEQRWLNVDLQVPPDPGLLGTLHTATATVASSTAEPNTTNNTYAITHAIVSSYDPNDKQGIANVSGSSTQFFLDQDQWVDYLVRFQNTGTDTAFTVVIRDELEADLDIESLEILGASHPYTPSFGGARELVFTFSDILLPDSTTDLLGSQGFVAFRLKPRVGLLPGDALENTAAIYFDFNSPVITEPSALVAEFSTGVAGYPVNTFQVWPVPAKDRLNITATSSISSLRVVASDGREVDIPYTRTAFSSLDVSGLQPGAYLLVVRYTEGTESRQRFIIQE